MIHHKYLVQNWQFFWVDIGQLCSLSHSVMELDCWERMPSLCRLPLWCGNSVWEHSDMTTLWDEWCVTVKCADCRQTSDWATLILIGAGFNARWILFEHSNPLKECHRFTSLSVWFRVRSGWGGYLRAQGVVISGIGHEVVKSVGCRGRIRSNDAPLGGNINRLIYDCLPIMQLVGASIMGLMRSSCRYPHNIRNNCKIWTRSFGKCVQLYSVLGWMIYRRDQCSLDLMNLAHTSLQCTTLYQPQTDSRPVSVLLIGYWYFTLYKSPCFISHCWLPWTYLLNKKWHWSSVFSRCPLGWELVGGYFSNS
jgi:hypothetical protein